MVSFDGSFQFCHLVFRDSHSAFNFRKMSRYAIFMNGSGFCILSFRCISSCLKFVLMVCHRIFCWFEIFHLCFLSLFFIDAGDCLVVGGV